MERQQRREAVMAEVSVAVLKRHPNTERTRTRILDAAEALFAERGYYGVSLRDITQAAGVQLALASYHFGSKEDLFRHVIARRADDHAAGLQRALEAVIREAGDTPPPLSAILHAFIAPVFERVLRGGEGWANYIRLLAQVSSAPQKESFVAPIIESYDPTVKAFIAQIARAMPTLDEEALNWAFYFYQAAIVHILTQAGLVDRQSGGLCQSTDLDRIAAFMIPYFTAGFEQLAAQNRQAQPDRQPNENAGPRKRRKG